MYPYSLTDPMLGGSPRHTQSSKDLLFVLALDKRPLGEPHALWTTHNIFEKTPLVQTQALCAGKEPQAPVEDVVPSEVYQSSAQLVTRNQKKIDASPYFGTRDAGRTMPFASIVFVCCGETTLNEALFREFRDQLLQHNSTKVIGTGVWTSDEAIDIPGVKSSTPERTSNDNIEQGVDPLQFSANNLSMLLHLGSWDALLEVFVVHYSNTLIFGELCLLQ